MTTKTSTLKETLINGLKELPQHFLLTPVNGFKAPYLTGWQHTGYSPDSPELIKEIKSGKAKGYGLLTGSPSGGIVAVDCDGDAAHKLAIDLGGLPPTVSFSSGKEGRAQYLYQVPQEYWGDVTTKKLKTGVVTDDKEVLLELRWNGCQSVLPPSVHPETGSYKWLNSIQNTPIAQAPVWVIEQMLVIESQSEPTPIEQALQEPNSFSFVADFYDEIPLYHCLSLTERGLIDSGATQGNRNDSGAKLARGLIGVESYLGNSGIRFSGTARQLYDQFCDRCSPPINGKERETIWKSAEKVNPTATLTEDAIENCIKSWKKRNSNGSENGNGRKSNSEGQDTTEASQESESDFKKTPGLVKAFEKAKRIIGNRIRLNLMNHDIELDGKTLDLECLELDLALELGLELKVGSRRLGSSQLEGVIFKIAKNNAYNPIKDYLEACNKKHKDTRILDNIAERYFGVDEPIYQTYVRKMLIAAVARIYEPGCQQDNTLILQSKGQGIGKSSFFKVLSGETYFCDDMGDFKEKDERLKLHQNWFLEWAELEKITSKKAAGAIKSFLSTREDQIRPPYARKAVKMQRQSIIVGTANPQEILFDPTGSRRYWVIPVSKRIPLELLQAERDQIWGAAVELYKSGETWWLDSDQQQQSESANENFQVHSFIQNEIEDYLLDKTQVTTRELLDFVVSLGFEVSNPQILKTVEQQIKAAVLRLKWEPCRLSIDGKRPRGYRCPENSSQATQPQNDPVVDQGGGSSQDGMDRPPSPSQSDFQPTRSSDPPKNEKNITSQSEQIDFDKLKAGEILFDANGTPYQLTEARLGMWETHRNIYISRNDIREGKYHFTTIEDVTRLIKEAIAKRDKTKAQWLLDSESFFGKNMDLIVAALERNPTLDEICKYDSWVG